MRDRLSGSRLALLSTLWLPRLSLHKSVHCSVEPLAHWLCSSRCVRFFSLWPRFSASRYRRVVAVIRLSSSGLYHALHMCGRIVEKERACTWIAYSPLWYCTTLFFLPLVITCFPTFVHAFRYLFWHLGENESWHWPWHVRRILSYSKQQESR